MGVANKKSVAWHIAKILEEEGANVLYSLRSEDRKKSLDKLIAGKPVFICDVEKPEDIERLKKEISAEYKTLNGLVHSIAFANYSEGWKPFHETPRKDIFAIYRYKCIVNCIVRCFKEFARQKSFCCNSFHFYHAYGGRKLWLHGTC